MKSDVFNAASWSTDDDQASCDCGELVVGGTTEMGFGPAAKLGDSIALVPMPVYQ